MELTAQTIPHQVRVTRRAKHISLKVDHRGLIIISPKDLSDKEINGLLNRHQDWISKHSRHILVAREDHRIQFGSTLNLLGAELRVTKSYSPAITAITRTESEIILPSNQDMEKLYKWIKQEAKVFIMNRVTQLATTHGFTFSDIRVRDQSTRWGSCSNTGNLNFSWRLALAPLYVLDYVILHELAHTKEMNHSPAFWDLVRTAMPNYQLAKSWLKENGYKLHLY